MEMYTSHENNKSSEKMKNNELYKEDTLTENGSAYAAFQSRDLVLQMEKKIVDDDPGHGPASEHPTSYFETLMHHFKGNVGSGIFALGDAFKHAGILLAPPLTIILGVICVHAQHILLRSNVEISQRIGNARPGYASTVELCFATGPVGVRKYSRLARALVNVFVCLTQFGFCCVYFVFISENMKNVLDYYGVVLPIKYHMAIILAPILLSTWIRNLKYLVPVSSIANILVIFGYFATMYIMCQSLPAVSERKYVAEVSNWPLFFGTVIYSFEGITLVLPLKNAMKKPRNFEKTFGVLNVGMVFVGFMFIAMGFISYLRYGDDVKSSVTLNLKDSDGILPQCIKLAISLSIMFSYALQFHVPVAIMWPVVARRYEPLKYPVFAEILFRTAMCFCTFVLAEVIPYLGYFISLVGAVSSTALALLFPPIVEMVLIWQNPKMSKFTFSKDILILVIGFLGCITGTYESISALIKEFQK